MARVFGTVKDMEEYKQPYQKQQQIKNRLIKKLKATYPKDEIRVLRIEQEITNEIIEEQPKLKRERKLTPHEQQMKKPIFSSNYETNG